MGVMDVDRAISKEHASDVLMISRFNTWCTGLGGPF